MTTDLAAAGGGSIGYDDHVDESKRGPDAKPTGG